MGIISVLDACDRQSNTRVVHHETKRVLTNEDWDPSYEGPHGMFIEVDLIGYLSGHWCVQAWGRGDVGRELDTRGVWNYVTQKWEIPWTNPEHTAKSLYERITDGTTRKQMGDWGMHPA